MKIKSFTVDGPLPTEIPALQDIERGLPSDWFGFANVMIRHPTKPRYEREVDLIIVTHDRIILVDLKHWAGKLELVDGYWHQDGERRDASPVEKMQKNVYLLKNAIEAESLSLGKIRVEGLVVLTHPKCDSSLLGKDGRVVMRIGDFLRLRDKYQTIFGVRSNHETDPLNAGNNQKVLSKFFNNGRIFEPRKTRFASYIAVGQPEFSTKLYTEYLAHDFEEPKATALLRVWDFENDDELRHSPDKKTLVERERAVLTRLADIDPGLAAATLSSRARDNDVGVRYWEIFERDRHLKRLSRFINDQALDLNLASKLDLIKILSGYIAGLHRAEIAHRDLGGHSIWIDASRLRVALSSFAAARFPDRKSAGILRAKLLGANVKLPEDIGIVSASSAYKQDVFLVAAAIWSILTGSQIPTNDGVPDWEAVKAPPQSISSELTAWLAKCLEWDPNARYVDGVEAHDALIAVLNTTTSDKTSVLDLKTFEAEIDPMPDYPVGTMLDRTRARIYTTLQHGEILLVKNWPERLIGDRSKNAARLVEFFGRADRLRSVAGGRLPRVRIACLSFDGIFVLQDYLEGEPLEIAEITSWTTENYRTFLLGLIETLEEAHELRLPHGDLSPRNILVATTDADVEARIIDFLDYSTEASGDRVTLAYAPAADDTDPYTRDRFAVGSIAQEMAGKITALAANELATIQVAIKACNDQEIPWATLRPLTDALSGKGKAAPGEAIRLTIPVSRCEAPGIVLADDGQFHVVLDRANAAVNIVGFDCQIILNIDRETGRLISARQNTASMPALAWAHHNKAFSFHGQIEVYQSVRGGGAVEGLEKLIDLCGAQWLEAIGNATPPAKPVDVPSRAASSPKMPLPRIARLWEAQITAEESLRPALTLIDEIENDSLHDVMIARHDDEIAIESVENGDNIFFNGTCIGFVVKQHSRPGLLAFRNFGTRRQLRLGDILVLQPGQTAQSLKRRAKAVERILHGNTPIQNLVSYFDPLSNAKPTKIAEPAIGGALDAYGLNADQIAAFDKLWTNGPVGLLQGPPGTGKTYFIAAFIHYALTKGGCRNVLLVSQSHEAVNTAAERIQTKMRDTQQDLDMLRVSNDPEKISDSLRRSHVDAIQDLYLARFEAEAKDRLCMVAKRLGLPRDFAADFFEAHAGPIEMARQIASLQSMRTSAEDAELLCVRVESLKEALEAQLRRFEIDAVEVSSNPTVIAEAVESAIIEKYDVRDFDAIRRLRDVQGTADQWMKTLRTRSRTLEEFFAGSRRLVCGTCVGIGSPKLRLIEKTYDLVVIDEAARSTSSELAVAMQSAKRILLVGDHKQLPPTLEREIVEEIARKTAVDPEDIKRSDFERVFESAYGRQVSAALQSQYRMAEAISKLVSDVFYPEVGLITARPEPGDHYNEMPYPFDHPFTWHDTGQPSRQSEIRKGTSFSNPAEAEAIILMLERLSGHSEFLAKALAEIKDGEPLVGVICMYAPQRDLIQDMMATSAIPTELRSRIKVETVDSYQGKENRIVIVSLVRNNQKGKIGFLDTENRINVAISRAMDRLILVGASTMFENSTSKLADVLKYVKKAKRLLNDATKTTEAA